MTQKNKHGRIIVNLLLIAIIGVFAAYFGKQLFRPTTTADLWNNQHVGEEVSRMEVIRSVSLNEPIEAIASGNGEIGVVGGTLLTRLNSSGEAIGRFAITKGIRDLFVADNGEFYILYPARIVVTDSGGTTLREWEACSDNSDYVAIAVTDGKVFVTDAANKNICMYDTQGTFRLFISSPESFVIPSYTFDIIGMNDTIVAVNAGKHRIESYATDGTYRSGWGIAGGGAGSFMGCCNPAYMILTPDGAFITSEKGIPRIAKYDREGKLQATLLAGKILGSGTNAYRIAMIGDTLLTARDRHVKFWIESPRP